jgi:hypothetical protein
MNTENRIGDWIQTYSGKQFWPLDPRPEEVFVEDIAHSLSRISRFGGHNKDGELGYSVAQHSVLVSRYSKHPKQGLFHDAPEAYGLGDILRPLKIHIPIITEIEQRIYGAVASCFRLPEQLDADVKHWDSVVMMMERRDLMGTPPAPWWPDLETLELPPEKIVILSPRQAEEQFLTHYYKLFSTIYNLGDWYRRQPSS